jgi:cold shock CspA family protein
MGRSQESFNKKEVRNKKEKKRKDKVAKRIARRDGDKTSLDDMIAYVDENGVISSTPPDEGNKRVINPDEIEVSVPRGSSNPEEDQIKRGVVSFFNESKGFGFIKDMQTQFDYFFHVNNVVDNIKEGNKVIFDIEKGQRGPVAVNIRHDK